MLYLWTVLVFSPAVLYLHLIGCDYLPNSLYVLTFTLGVILSYNDTAKGNWKQHGASVLLGIGLSSRANFLLLLPLIFSALRYRAGWRVALMQTAVSCAVFAIITVPFYLYDAESFSPLHNTYRKLSSFGSAIPSGAVLIPAATGIVALLLSRCGSGRGALDILLERCAIVLAIPILCGIILASLRSGNWDFSFGVFGVFFLFFGAIPNLARIWGDIAPAQHIAKRADGILDSLKATASAAAPTHSNSSGNRDCR
ncbi:MAG: hypothetical protein FJY95_03785 [Candidatus Handelsmanbacteria bacterium]|nr:hypothetical protein [Candidatus Handelsmanbacteria bacterium]